MHTKVPYLSPSLAVADARLGIKRNFTRHLVPGKVRSVAMVEVMRAIGPGCCQMGCCTSR